MTKQKNVHVDPNVNQWSAKSVGSNRAGENYDIQAEAIGHARFMAINNYSEMHILCKNGQISKNIL